MRRECREETGLAVEVGPLVYVREFAEPLAGRFHMELFYRVDAWRTSRTWPTCGAWVATSSISARSPGSPRRELPRLSSYYPAELLDDVWERLAEAQPLIRHLGLQR